MLNNKRDPTARKRTLRRDAMPLYTRKGALRIGRRVPDRFRRRAWARLALLLGSLAISAGAIEGPRVTLAAEAHSKVDFNFQVRPILSDKCFNCHGPDPRMRKAGLRLDTKEGAFGTTKSGARPVVPFDLEASELYRRITAEDTDERLPPKSL